MPDNALNAPLSALPFTLPALRRAYAEGLRPEAVVAEAFRRLDAIADPGIFIHDARETAIAEAAALGAPDGRPLWGIPFAVKDNIDVAGMPTTVACPDFAHMAHEDAFVIARLRAAGAICLGKTNLDQFATGLVGLRTPYPAPLNAVDPAIVPGGSSSGSGVIVGRQIVPFALGTDTAGSGRVPAALNDVVGLKPTIGTLSASGVAPACRTLDTVSIFAQTVADAWDIYALTAAHDPADAYSRTFPAPKLSALPPSMRIAVPDAASLMTYGDNVQADYFRDIIARLRTIGAVVEEVDFTPFYAIAEMLYQGPWVAERIASVGARLDEAPETLHPTTRAILEGGRHFTAVDAFQAQYRLAELKQRCLEEIAEADFICVPTIPRFVSVQEVEADAMGPNAQLGIYTNFVNLLDLCGMAVPTTPRADGRPGSLTILGRAGTDARVAALALKIERDAASGPVELDDLAPDEIALAVCGAHMSSLPLNPELTSRGARFLRACRTAPHYRFYALAGGPPERPGLVHTGDEAGAGIAVEVWALPRTALGDFMAGIPAPLSIGTVVLEDGSRVKGFLCEAYASATAHDITASGGWRSFLRSSRTAEMRQMRA
ncbi:allophanate hydrolase [Xanthobacter sp. TB0139]|uniref:allophanate hydrolase n=1 Tax=Xanthobacter sp. TB0139 TaxID=3459178 RepID=UPI00403A2F22